MRIPDAKNTKFDVANFFKDRAKSSCMETRHSWCPGIMIAYQINSLDDARL